MIDLKNILKNKPKILPVNHLAALLTDSQRCVYLHVKKDELKELENFLQAIKLNYEVIGNSKTTQAIDKKLYDVLISKEKKHLLKTRKSFLSQDIRWAMDLGYPQCCVDSFIKWAQNYYKNTTIIEYIYENSPRKIFSFLLNNITNFFSRTFLHDKSHYNKFNKKRILFDRINSKINQYIDYEPIILWHPCSYVCKESLKRAKNIFDFLSTFFPRHAMYKRSIFSKFVIFKDDFEFVFANVNYKLNKKEMIINKIDPIRIIKTLIDQNEIKKIKLPQRISKKNKLKLNGLIVIPFSQSYES